MAKISLRTFGGIFPKISPRLIPEHAATIASYCRLDSGRLGAFGQNVDQLDHDAHTFQVPLTTKTIHRHTMRDGSHAWLVWDKEVHAIPSPVREDQWDRLYWSGDIYPRYALGTEVAASVYPNYQPSAARKLGIPRPAAAPIAVKTADTGDAAASVLFRAYAYTYVSGLGEEGAPSPASEVISCRQADTVTLTFGAAPPNTMYDTAGNPSRRRIYRTNVDGDFQFLADIDLSATEYVDTVVDEALGEILGTSDYDAPPDEDAGEHPDGPLQMMTQMPNGIVAGYTGRTICFSEAYLPHVFPTIYQLTTRYRITGLLSLSIGLLVLTEGKPALVTGNSPAAMTLQELDDANSCVSRRSIVDMGGMGLFAGPDGLIVATEGGMRCVTTALFSNRQWADMAPSSMHAYPYDGRYLFFYDNGTTKGGYMIDFTTDQPQLVSLPFYALAGYYDPVGGDLYLAIDNGGGLAQVRKFDAGADADFDWQSREVRIEAPINPGCAIVDAETYPIQFDLYGDGIVRHSQSVGDGEMFRLPDGYLAREWQIRLRGTGLVNAVHVAEHPQELMSG
jgi:hypothetical protein